MCSACASTRATAREMIKWQIQPKAKERERESRKRERERGGNERFNSERKK